MEQEMKKLDSCRAELENESRTPADSAKACQDQCAATDGCSFFSFKEAGAGCHMSSKAARQTYAKGVVGGSVTCDAGGLIFLLQEYHLSISR